VAPFLTALFLFSTPAQSRCGRAYEAVVAVAQREENYGYAREVSSEGRGAFISACRRHLTPAQVRCIVRARSSDELYACTP
jgi:hypothetical protein